MKKLVIALIPVALVALSSQHAGSPSASAAGVGGTLSLGPASANTVPVNTTTATNQWSGYNIYISTGTSSGVALTSIAGANGTLLTGSTVCGASTPLPSDKVWGCGSASTVTASGLLATFTFNASGNGCITAVLVAGNSASPDYAVVGTFTMDAVTRTPQANVVSSAIINVLFGTGTSADCVAPTPPLVGPVRDHKTDANGDGYSAADEVTAANCGVSSCSGILTLGTRETRTCKDAGRACGIPNPPIDESGAAHVGGSSTGYGCGTDPKLAKSDIDLDGVVTILDLAKVAGWFGNSVNSSTADPRWEGNMDGDGVITILDLATMASYFGKSVAADCPFPNSVSLIIADNYLHANDGCVNVPSSYDWSLSAVTRSPFSPRAANMAAWAMFQWDCNHDFGSPGMQIEVRDFRMYALIGSVWSLIDSGVYGSQINPPCMCGGVIYGDAGSGPIFNAPPHGQGIQFYQGMVPVPSGITGMYARYQARLVTDDGAAFLMLNVGADWANLNPYAGFGDMGISRLKRVTSVFQWFGMTTLTNTQLLANPPPMP